jgi:hypothetical protein
MNIYETMKQGAKNPYGIKEKNVSEMFQALKH